MVKQIDVFYAYPAEPRSGAESIELAVKELRESKIVEKRRVRIKLWPEVSIAGKHVMLDIADNIDKADIFACDLTYRNSNVAFELGYAIGRFKRIWISLNTGIEGAGKDFLSVYYNMLGGLGYKDYTNHQNLADGFVTSSPWVDLDTTPLGSAFRSKRALEEWPTLFYVKPPTDTDAVITTIGSFQSSMFKASVITDDSRENAAPTLEWYAGKILTADAVLVQLLAQNQRDSANHNLKCSFTAGLAHGFRKPLLMLAPNPYDPPTDYRTLLRVHDTAQQCGALVKSWFETLELRKRRTRRPLKASGSGESIDLHKLSIGDPMAENERVNLNKYFVKTSAYYRALEKPTTIVVGRRGTGKTANLYAMQGAITVERHDNHVCVISPDGYELDGLVRVLNENLDRAERGYLIQSLWKFLIYSELARSLFDEISALPVYIPRTTEQERFMEYVTSRSDDVLMPFAHRLDKVVRTLVGVGNSTDAVQQETRISELLHNNELRVLRELLGLVLSGRDRVAILIDNLDKPWDRGGDIDRLSELLLGLLDVVEDISNEFQHEDRWRKRVNISVTVFLRSDIFALIQPLAAEQDKLPLQRIVWDDPEVLLMVLGQRFEYAMGPGIDVREIWRLLFPSEVAGVPTSEFILRTVVPRPRDIIYLVGQAIDVAINRGHEAVTADDFVDARNNYSAWVFKSVLAEDDPRKGKLRAVLYEFAGAPKIMKSFDVRTRITRAGVEYSDIEFYVDLLCDVNFLGIQTASQGFRYSRDENERELLRQVAKRLAVERSWGEESYEIKAAFYWALEIE